MKNKMTIIFVVDTFPSISETFILNQITGLIDLGHDVLIFSASRSQETSCHAEVQKYELLKKTYYHNERPGGKIYRLIWAVFMVLFYGHRNSKAIINSLNVFKYGKEALSLTYLYKVMLFLGVGQADVILCHYGPNGNFGALMKELGIKGKLITMFHGYDIRRGIEKPGIYKPLFKRCDGILSISEYSCKHLLEFGAPVQKIYNHPVGIDVLSYAVTRKPLPEGEKIKILTVSRLVPEKGLSYGIEAIYKLVKRGITNIEYHILGDGPLREELEALVRKFNLKDKVFFLGYQVQAGVIQELKESHLFLLPSVAEALPVVLMEAQAAGLPVVATNVGSVAQLLIDGQSGYLVPSQDPDAMAAKLESLIRNPQGWQTMGAVGHAHILKNYNIKELNKSLVQLCKNL
jgi:colanic acid/amylovoran biosynthesis glycosyltransferase